MDHLIDRWPELVLPRRVRQAWGRWLAARRGSIGGRALRLAQDCIRYVEVLEYPELGMEAGRKIDVEDFPALIVVDDNANDIFDLVTSPVSLG